MFHFNMPVKYISSGLFSFNGEWIHPDRVLIDNEIIVMVEGCAKLCVENQKFVLSTGDVLIIPKGKRHYGFEKSYGTNSFYWGHFIIEDNSLDTLLFRHINTSSLALLFKQLIHTAHSNDYNPIMNDYYISLILLDLEHLVTSTNKQNKLIEEIKDYIGLYYENITVRNISEHFGYNSDYLSRLFKIILGISIQKYIMQIKIEKSKEKLMKTHMSINEIAMSLGYLDTKSFSKIFKQYENMTPSAYRNIFCTKHTNNN